MLALALLAATAPVHAQQGDTTELATLRAELESLKAEEAERDARIQRIEEALLRLSGETTAPVEATGATAPTPSPSPAVVDAQAVTAQATASDAALRPPVSIGRAQCRVRECQYDSISVVVAP